ncbi:MAG: pectate lyase [Prevotella sp.]|nr:pectate lyase [Prevotella sp.]
MPDNYPKVTAFPGAEGFGRYTTGGRGGKVYHVSTLEDGNQPGTLRWANEQKGPRTIVFDVSGTIFLKSPLRISPNTTIAGQTAPGDGICIADYPVLVGSNNIIRYVRFRLGNREVAHHEGDGLGSGKGHNIIVDHCSVSWSIDECLSVYGCNDFTIQWCIVSQSLNNAGHKKGAHGYGGNWGGSGASYHHNLLAHHTSRTPRLGPSPQTQADERMDMRNNVIYNWTANGCYGGEAMTVNIVNNYYKPGPGTPTDLRSKRIAAPNIRTSQYTHHDSQRPNVWDKMWHVWGKYYVDGNVNSKYPEVTQDNWTYGVYNQIDAAANDGTYTATTKDSIRLRQPMPFAPVTTHTAEQAYELVLAHAGASLHRDALDDIIVRNVREGKATFTGKDCPPGIINSQEDVILGNSPWPELKSTPAPKDSDGDGMPDEWERQHGLNPNDANDGNQTATDGYTNLEHYLNGIITK